MTSLAHETYRRGFFEALRQLECESPDSPRIGHADLPDQEACRFGQTVDLGFPATDLHRWVEGTGPFPPSLLVYCFGLTGPSGPMPTSFTEYVYGRLLRHGDPTWTKFLDVFHHRLISLFYRVWAEHRHAVSFDRADDPMGRCLASLLGFGTPAFHNRDSLSRETKLHVGGRLLAAPPHAEGLRAILSRYFGLPVDVKEFVGHWWVLPEDCRTRLGLPDGNAELGKTAILGERVWDRSSQFRVRLGPMTLRRYHALLPPTRGMRQVRDWLLTYVGLELDWEVQLAIRGQDVPGIRLDKKGGPQDPGSDPVECRGKLLGWTSWLADGPQEQDRDDLNISNRRLPDFPPDEVAKQDSPEGEDTLTVGKLNTRR